MKKVLLLVSGLILAFSLRANHIVGGEIEFITIEPGSYRINLIQYRDEAQTLNPTPDLSVLVYIFSNKDHRFVGSYTLPLTSLSEVSYTNQECAIDELKTSRVIYSLDVALEPSDYADEEGYYIVWERCCRNLVVKNIINPGGTGMKYVVEIPPLWKDGKPFINSSPVLLRPLSDYACIDQLYYTDFTGTDPDGDSLVYRLATPLNSSAADPADPIPQPKPHIEVFWANGFSLDSVVPGNPPLRVSGRGLLTVEPFTTGVYVFSVVVEEWRDKQKIGEVQRDFQMLVVDGCNPPDPPEVGVKIPGDEDFDPVVDVLNYTLEDDKCFDFLVTNISAGETIRLRSVPVNFDAELDDLFSITSSFVKSGQDTLIVKVCAPGCPPVRDGPFIIDLIASDDACPLPQMDTVRLTINVEPPPNDFPGLSALPPGYTVDENESLTIDFTATDADQDSVVMNLVIPGVVNTEEYGISLNITHSEKGLVQGSIEWDTDCALYDFTNFQNFQLGILPEDLDICELENPNIRWLNMGVVLPLNTSPVVSIDSDAEITVQDGQSVSVEVEVNDLDMDKVNLMLVTPGFEGRSLGVTFQDTSGIGVARSVFQWEVDCHSLGLSALDGVFEFHFVAEDEDRCEIVNSDTVVLIVNVEIQENTKPEILPQPEATLEINVPFEMDITAEDFDAGDSVSIEFFNPARLPRSESLFFEPKTGLGTVTSTLRWTPECALLDLGESSKLIDLIFLAYDNGCPIQKLDTLKMTFEVRETREQFAGFLPPNVFTPNGDGKNETFTLTNLSEPRQNLPQDNCEDAFEYISIHDRSGATVFRSTSREFSWDGKDAPVGVYYYLIKYQRTEYNGYLQLLR